MLVTAVTWSVPRSGAGRDRSDSPKGSPRPQPGLRGSGAGVAAAGPSIVVAYAVSGLLVMLVMRMLGEMSAAYPSSGSFSAHAERAIGPWAGFTAGWAFWVLLCTAVGLEGIGAAKIVT